jgi:hypothetical protein
MVEKVPFDALGRCSVERLMVVGGVGRAVFTIYTRWDSW